MKIKWIGKYDGKNLPTVDVEVGAKELPEVTSKSAIMLIPIVLLFACCVFLKLVDCLEKCLIYGHIRRFAN